MTNELGQIINMQDLINAKHYFKKAQQIYREGNYFDCLGKVQKSLACFGSDEPPTRELKRLLPKVYNHMKDCYL